MDKNRKSPAFTPLTPEEMKRIRTSDGNNADRMGCITDHVRCADGSSVSCSSAYQDSCSYIYENGYKVGVVCNGNTYRCPSGTGTGSGSGGKDLNDHKPIDGNKL